jgi:hypothetical protein
MRKLIGEPRCKLCRDRGIRLPQGAHVGDLAWHLPERRAAGQVGRSDAVTDRRDRAARRGRPPARERAQGRRRTDAGVSTRKARR